MESYLQKIAKYLEKIANENSFFDFEWWRKQAANKQKQKVCVIDLSTARTDDDPFEISPAFRYLAVKTVSGVNDTLTRPVVYFQGDEHIPTENKNKVPLFANDQLKSDAIYTKGFLTWDAQPGVRLVLVSSLYDTLENGGVEVSGGTIIALPPKFKMATTLIALASGSTQFTLLPTATAGVPRKARFVNSYSTTFSISSNTGFAVNDGVKVLPGESYETESIDSVYIRSVDSGYIPPSTNLVLEVFTGV